jgi:hypothetical protein
MQGSPNINQITRAAKKLVNSVSLLFQVFLSVFTHVIPISWLIRDFFPTSVNDQTTTGCLPNNQPIQHAKI